MNTWLVAISWTLLMCLCCICIMGCCQFLLMVIQWVCVIIKRYKGSIVFQHSPVWPPPLPCRLQGVYAFQRSRPYQKVPVGRVTRNGMCLNFLSLWLTYCGVTAWKLQVSPGETWECTECTEPLLLVTGKCVVYRLFWDHVRWGRIASEIQKCKGFFCFFLALGWGANW